jgi:molybdate transport system substrate-binding protein
MPATIVFGSLHEPISASRLMRLVVSTALALTLVGGSAHTAEIRLLSAAAMQSLLEEIAYDFERGSEHRLATKFATVGAINQRVLGGETADLIIGSTPSISGLLKAGKIRSDSQVPSDTPKPIIASVEDLKRALLAAKTVIHADPAGGDAAGIRIAAWIEKMGISERIKSKDEVRRRRRHHGSNPCLGPGALGLTQISEIVNKPDAEFVAPLRVEIQSHTEIQPASQPDRHGQEQWPRSSPF